MERHERPTTTRQELVKRLRADLERNAWPAGTQLEPIRRMAESYGVSYVTMRRALMDLQAEGLLDMRRGAGIYIADPEDLCPAHGAYRPSKRVAMVLPPSFGLREPEILSGILGSFLPCMERHGWETLPISTADQRSNAPAFLDELIGRGIDAVVWLSPLLNHKMNLMRLHDRGVPVVAFGRRFPDMPFPTITLDLRGTMELIAARCREEGLDRVGFVGPPVDEPDADPVAVDRLVALREAAALSDPPIAIDPVLPWASHMGLSPEAMRTALEPYRDVRTWVLVFQQYAVGMGALACNGFWENPRTVTLFDTMGHGEHVSRSGLGGLRYIRAKQPAEAEGRALAREIERLWVGEAAGPEPELKPVLEEGGND